MNPRDPVLVTTGNKFLWNSNRNSVIFIKENAFEIVVCRNGGHFCRVDELIATAASSARWRDNAPMHSFRMPPFIWQQMGVHLFEWCPIYSMSRICNQHKMSTILWTAFLIFFVARNSKFHWNLLPRAQLLSVSQYRWGHRPKWSVLLHWLTVQTLVSLPWRL